VFVFDWLGNTDPVTGSHFETGHSGSQYYPLGNRQLDPLGRDVTEPPDPLNYEEPVYLNPQKDFFWPVEYQWNDITLVGETRSQRDLAMSAWEQGMIDIQDKLRAEDAWKRGDQATWEKILANNPNVGIEEGGRTLWGREASEFLTDRYYDMLAQELGGVPFSQLQTGKDQVVPLPDLKKGVGVLLSNKDCAKFVKRLINEAASSRVTGEDAISDNPLDIIASVRIDFSQQYRSNGTPLNGQLTTPRNEDPTGIATIGITPQSAFGKTQGGYAAIIRGYVEGFLHELIHASAKTTAYYDRHLAQAVVNLGLVSRKDKKKFKKLDPKDVAGNSAFWDKVLQKHCGVKSK
jgi:hypothetical protein